MSAPLEIPPLPASTILLVEVGSIAHGTGIPGGEDHDEIGVVVETPDQLVTLDAQGFRTVMQRTQPQGAPSGPGDIDRTLHSLRQFLRLSAAGNPSILMAFWAPVELVTPEGEELRALGDALVGRHVIPRYQGYMQDQGDERWVSSTVTPMAVPPSAPCAARLGFQGVELMTTGRLQLPIQGEPADWLRAVRRGDVSFDDWWARCLDLDAQLAALSDDESIPLRADRARIDAWSIDVHRRFWGRRAASELVEQQTPLAAFDLSQSEIRADAHQRGPALSVGLVSLFEPSEVVVDALQQALEFPVSGAFSVTHRGRQVCTQLALSEQLAVLVDVFEASARGLLVC